MGGGERRGRNRRVGGDVPYHSHCGQWSRCTSTDKGDRGMWDLRGRVRGGGGGGGGWAEGGGDYSIICWSPVVHILNWHPHAVQAADTRHNGPWRCGTLNSISHRL